MKKFISLYLIFIIAGFLISQVQAATQIATVNIDGDKSDWSSLMPAIIDDEGNSVCGSSGDIKSVYTAMDTNYVYFMVETHGTPIESNNTSVEINFDYKPGQQFLHGFRDDISINVNSSGLFAIFDTNLDGNLEDFFIKGEQIAWGNVLEVRIPLAQLSNPSYFEPTFVNFWNSEIIPPDNNSGCDPVTIRPTQGLEYMYVQQRNYESGDTFNRLYFSMYDQDQYPPGDVLASATLYDPNGEVVNISFPTYAPGNLLMGNYDVNSGQWNFSSGFDYFDNGYGADFDGDLIPGNYRLQVITINGYTDERTFKVSAPVECPIISSSSFHVWIDQSDNLVWEWALPSIDPGLNTSISAFMAANGDNENFFWISVPTDVNRITIPKTTYDLLKAGGDNINMRLFLRVHDEFGNNFQRNISNPYSQSLTSSENNLFPDFAGELTVTPNSALAPAAIQFETFVAQGLPPFTYEYDFGDSTTTTGTRKTTHTYQNAGSYTATITVRDNTGAVFESRKTILVTDPSRITDLTDNLQNDADEITLAGDGENISRLLGDAGNIIQQTLEPIVNAEDAFKGQIQTSVQSKTETLAGNTFIRLNALIQEQKVTKQDLGDISSKLADVASNMVKNKVPVTDRTLNDLKSTSGTIYAQTLDTLLQNESLSQTVIDTLKTDKAAARNFFRDKPYLLDDIADNTGIQVNTTTGFNPEKITDRADRHGLTEVQTGQLLNAVEPTRDNSLAISSISGISLKTIAQIAQEIYHTHFGKTVTQTTMDDIARNLLLAFSDGSYVSFIVRAVSIVEDYMPEGLFDLPNGNKLGVTDTYALEFTSYPVFPHSFASEVIKLGIDPVITQDGGLRIQLDTSASLSLRPGWDYFKSNAFDSMTTSFSVQGGTNPAAEAYALLATYDTGFSQLLPPSIMAIQALTKVLDTTMPGDYRIDSDTGVLTLGSLKLKPDYVFTSTTKTDRTAIEGSGGFIYLGLGFEIADVNHDGITDILLHSESPMGRQVLFGLPG